MLNLLFQNPVLFLIMFSALVYAITIHEFAHALAGKLEGDDTAESQGRVTLDPRSHLDWLGLVMVLVVGFGWGKPTPYNPYQLKHPKWGPVWIGLAGPLSNVISGIIFAVLAGLVWQPVLGEQSVLYQFFFIFSFLNFGLTLFNLIPVPPLDGSALLLALLPDSQWALKQQLQALGPQLFYVLIFASVLIPGFSFFSFISHWSGLGSGLIIRFVTGF